jgi:hypothetical protein
MIANERSNTSLRESLCRQATEPLRQTAAVVILAHNHTSGVTETHLSRPFRLPSPCKSLIQDEGARRAGMLRIALAKAAGKRARLPTNHSGEQSCANSMIWMVFQRAPMTFRAANSVRSL